MSRFTRRITHHVLRRSADLCDWLLAGSMWRKMKDLGRRNSTVRLSDADLFVGMGGSVLRFAAEFIAFRSARGGASNSNFAVDYM